MTTVLAAIVVLAGCGGSTATTTSTSAPESTATTSIPAGSASYVGQATNAEILVQWTRAGNALSGSLQEALRKEPGSDEVVSSSRAFTGTVAGNGLTLTLPEGLGTTKALVGTVSGNGFTMTFPAEGHELLSLTFVPGTVADYNHAVKEIEGKAEHGGEASTTTGQAGSEAPSDKEVRTELEQMRKAEGHGSPILAGPWSSDQEGYGHVEPDTIFNGGDPTGRVKHIHWTSWGGAQAVGTGVSDYVAPNQATAEGTEEPARIVLFQLAQCHGRSAYNAIEWYFPQHGQTFSPTRYINACTGQYAE
jgi:hypothetical protein